MKKCEHLIRKKLEEYQRNEVKIWKILGEMSDREIALSSIGAIAREAGVGRNTLYNHRTAYQHITECRLKEAELLRNIEIRI